MIAVLVLMGAAVIAPAESAAQGPRVDRAAGFYDATLGRVVLIGGTGQARAADRDGVWSWSGARWEPTPGPGPSARSTGGAAYDARRRMAVVTGGMRRAANDSSFEVISETWEGTPTTWQRIAGIEVEARDHQSLVFDEGRQAVLMFGGIPGNRSSPWPSDTWELRPEGWVRISTEGPAGRGRTALAYDSKRHQTVMFGGVGAPPAGGGAQPFFNDTWVLEGTNWKLAAQDGPRARYAHGMVFDERAGVVLLYSGAAAHQNAPLTDMWQWDGSRWTEIRLTGPTPGYRYQPVMVYDRARGRTILYGGAEGPSDDTWEWDGRQWKEVKP